MLLDTFKSPPQTREEGIYFEDRQYKCVRADTNSIYAKCVSAKYTQKLNSWGGEVITETILLF